MSLTIHEDDSVTLTEKRSHVCLEAAWELEALAELLCTVVAQGEHKTDAFGYQVRCIAGRVKQLASIQMSGLGDKQVTTDDLERQLKVSG